MHEQTFYEISVPDITGRKKGLPNELVYEDMRDYIRREMAAGFDAMKAASQIAALERQGALKTNGKAGRAMGQEVVKKMPVIIL